MLDLAIKKELGLGNGIVVKVGVISFKKMRDIEESVKRLSNATEESVSSKLEDAVDVVFEILSYNGNSISKEAIADVLTPLSLKTILELAYGKEA